MRVLLWIFTILSINVASGQDRNHKISDKNKPTVFNPRMVIPSSLSYSASYEGTHSYERVGYSLSGIGDVNGDGYDDFIIGNTHTNLSHPLPDRGDAGSVHLILGRSSGFQMGVSLENADARFTGKNRDDAVGLDVANRGDVNGDGLNDILIGAPGKVTEPDNHGRAYLVFGRAAADWGYDFVLEDTADASFDGEATAYITGQSVDIIGDLNGDGYDEFIIGAPLADDETLDRGKVYLFKGRAQGWQRHIPVTDADAIFYGDVDYGQAGHRTKGVGDVNGDGIPDFAISNKNLVGTGGQVFLIFGRSSVNWGTSFQLSDADVIITGEDPNTPGWAGWQIAPAGDVNGDGLDDMLIGDRWYGTYQGKVGLFFGKRTGWTDMSMAQADVTYLGVTTYNEAGHGLAGNFDLDNDGLSDFLIGAPYNGTNGKEAGEAYLVMGKRDGWQGTVNLMNVGDYFRGAGADELTGYAVSSAGDVNRDGADDFIVSAPYNDDPGYQNFGKIFLFLGHTEHASVGGTVQYHAGAPVSNVAIQVDGIPWVYTNGSASYSINLPIGSDKTVTPFKTEGEDVGVSTISSYDAALTARYVVGLESFSTLQNRCADVDGDGAVLMYDAVQVARYAVGLPDLGSVNIGQWIFDPAFRIYNDIQQPFENQDYSAMIVGDVDGGWNETSSLLRIEHARLWETSCLVEGNDLTIHFSITGNSTLLSYDLFLTYDEGVYRFKGCDTGPSGKMFRMFSSAARGIVRLGGFSVDPVVEAGRLFNIQFEMTGKPSKSDDKIILDKIQLNRDIVGSEIILWEMGSRMNPLADFRIMNNYPNPFNRSTKIEFEMLQRGRMQVLVFDQQGRTVCELMNESLTSGRHYLNWNGTNHDGAPVSSGLYLFSLVTAHSVKTLKVMLIK